MKKVEKIILFIIVVTILVIIMFENSGSNVDKKEFENESNNIIVNDKDNAVANTVEKSNPVQENVKEGRTVTKKLIVVNVEEKILKTMDLNDDSLYVISTKNEDMTRFKQGQEIKIFYDGIILTTYPGQITADKVEILKEKSDKEIPIEVLRHYNYSQNNISVSIDEFSNENLNFYIIDSNEYPLDYGDYCEYQILKKNTENEEFNNALIVKNKEERDVELVETDGKVTATKPYNPNAEEYKTVWEEIKVLKEDNKLCNWIVNSDNILTLRGKINWKDIYGKLGEGEYEIKLYRTPEKIDSFFKCVRVKFLIDENGKLTYEEPSLGW